MSRAEEIARAFHDAHERSVATDPVLWDNARPEVKRLMVAVAQELLAAGRIPTSDRVEVHMHEQQPITLDAREIARVIQRAAPWRNR